MSYPSPPLPGLVRDSAICLMSFALLLTPWSVGSWTLAVNTHISNLEKRFSTGKGKEVAVRRIEKAGEGRVGSFLEEMVSC